MSHCHFTTQIFYLNFKMEMKKEPYVLYHMSVDLIYNASITYISILPKEGHACCHAKSRSTLAFSFKGCGIYNTKWPCVL